MGRGANNVLYQPQLQTHRRDYFGEAQQAWRKHGDARPFFWAAERGSLPDNIKGNNLLTSVAKVFTSAWLEDKDDNLELREISEQLLRISAGRVRLGALAQYWVTDDLESQCHSKGVFQRLKALQDATGLYNPSSTPTIVNPETKTIHLLSTANSDTACGRSPADDWEDGSPLKDINTEQLCQICQEALSADPMRLKVKMVEQPWEWHCRRISASLIEPISKDLIKQLSSGADLVHCYQELVAEHLGSYLLTSLTQQNAAMNAEQCAAIRGTLAGKRPVPGLDLSEFVL